MNIGTFLQHDIWIINEQTLSPARRMGLWVLRRIVITTNCFIDNNLSSYTAALTFSCILAAVPVLAIVLAIGRGFGFGAFIEERLRENIQISDEVADTVFSFVNHYLERASGGLFLGVGLVLLVYTVVMLTSNIESAFNTIWHVRSPRNIYRKIVDYVSVFMLLPLLIVVTSGFSIFMLTVAGELRDYRVISGTMEFVIHMAPLIISGLSFTVLYKLLPNTVVRWRSVLFPGFMAGIFFQLLQYIYIHYQLELSFYNATYGSFAALPLFMLWMQISWYICLIGAQLSNAIQRGDEYVFAKDSQHLSRQTHDALCLLLLAEVSKRFELGAAPYSTHKLARATHLPHSVVQGLLDEMTQAQLVCEIHNEQSIEQFYLPAIDINRLTPNFILHRLDANGIGELSPQWTARIPQWTQLQRIRNHFSTLDGEKPVKDLV